MKIVPPHVRLLTSAELMAAQGFEEPAWDRLSDATKERIRKGAERFGVNSLQVFMMANLPELDSRFKYRRPSQLTPWRFQMVIRGGEHVGYRVYKPHGLLGTYTFHSYQWF